MTNTTMLAARHGLRATPTPVVLILPFDTVTIDCPSRRGARYRAEKLAAEHGLGITETDDGYVVGLRAEG